MSTLLKLLCSKLCIIKLYNAKLAILNCTGWWSAVRPGFYSCPKNSVLVNYTIKLLPKNLSCLQKLNNWLVSPNRAQQEGEGGHASHFVESQQVETNIWRVITKRTCLAMRMRRSWNVNSSQSQSHLWMKPPTQTHTHTQRHGECHLLPLLQC